MSLTAKMPTKWCDQGYGSHLSVCSQGNMNCHFQVNISVFCRLLQAGRAVVWSLSQSEAEAWGASGGFFAVSQDTESRHREKQRNQIYRAQHSFMSLLIKVIDVIGRLWVFLFLFYYLLSYVWVCFSVFSYICACVLCSPEGGLRYLSTGVTNGCGALCGCWESNPGLKAANAYNHRTISPVPSVQPLRACKVRIRGWWGEVTD